MKQSYPVLKSLCLMLGFLTSLPLSAQVAPENPQARDWSEYFPKALPTFPSPNAEAFMVFGQIPVTKYTGTPDIRIPLYTLKHCDISIPISLAYHTASRKVNSMPSWVGLGWNMDAGGVITRTVRGKRDENASILNGVPNGSAFPQGFMYNHDLWENGKWNNYEKLQGNIDDPRIFPCIPPPGQTIQGIKPFDPLDALPDEFNFNFLGYSGSFHFDPNTEEFVVESDANIQVVFDRNSDIVKGREISDVAFPLSNWMGAVCDNFEDYIIHFQLITPDGFRYDFGGLNATEVSVPRQNTHKSQFSTSSWFLTKITSPLGNEVTFNYDRGEVICNLSVSYQSTLYKSSFYHCGKGNKCPDGESATRQIEGQVIYPVYLKSIVADQAKIVFNKNSSQALHYSTEDQNKPSYSNVGSLGAGFTSGLNGVWKKLNSIYVYEGQSMAKRFSFFYTNTPFERLKLKSLREASSNTASKVYTFEYNANLLPDFCSESTDHWGYANDFRGLPYTGTGENFYDRKEPTSDPWVYLAEILEKITYPSGGYTLLEYEPHDYAKVVSENRASVNSLSETKIAGGVRIKSIASYDSEGSQTHSIKTYNYRKGGHHSHAIPASNALSSGILSTTPKYYYYVDNNIPLPYEPDNVRSIFSSGMVIPFGDAAFGNHVGYSEVTEIESTRTTNNQPATLNNYTRSFFTSFDEDIYGNSHCDWGMSGITNSIHNGQMYISFSRSPERGKLLLERQYRKNASLASEVQNTYELVYYAENIKMGFNTFDYYPACNIRGYIVDMQSQLYIIPSSYLLKSTRTTLFGTHANDTMREYTENTYNQDRQITRIRTTDSYENTVETFIKYPRDFSINTSSTDREVSALRLMASHKHMINKPILVYQTKNNQVVAASFQTFATFDNAQTSDRIAVLPYRFYELKIKEGASSFIMPSFSGNTPSIESRFKLQHTCELYDNHGNLRALSDKYGITSCLIWGYNQTLPCAMIVNTSWNSIANAINISAIENSYDEEAIRDIINTLRQHNSLKKAQIYGYAYKKPWGISAITDPSGVTTHYQYDGLGRLISVKDDNFNLLEKIMYNYKIK